MNQRSVPLRDMKLIKSLGLMTFAMLSGCSGGQLADEGKPIHEVYLKLTENPELLDRELRNSLGKRWELSHTPMILEANSFSRSLVFSFDLVAILQKGSGEKLAEDIEDWRQWLWKQEYKPLPDYPEFKSKLYGKIDPRFSKYFDNDRASTIRLDEVRWGGVVQDGIPPLRKPKMIAADEADYLAPTDVVFGIEVAGEFRAYPKRILAWHEMFVDTIQGVPLAGVY